MSRPPGRHAHRHYDERIARARWDRLSLLWRVFAVNAVVCGVAVAVLAWAPVTVHTVATPSELAVLAVGLVLMLGCDLLLLRRAFAPLRRLAATMGDVDPEAPGRRAQLPPGAGVEVRALAAALNTMLERLERLERERRESGGQALAAQERERGRIARELHDEVGQTLTAIALQAERAAAHAGPGPQRDALTEITDTAQRSLEDVRRIGRELRPEALDDLGLVNALLALCTRMDERQGLRVERELDWHLPALAPEVELVVYRTAQEALTNVLRHADAQVVTVGLRRADRAVVLRVRDDGRGVTVHERDGAGLRGMRERARMVGAELQIRTSETLGTEITLSVPA